LKGVRRGGLREQIKHNTEEEKRKKEENEKRHGSQGRISREKM